MFSVAWPLAACCFLVNNWVELRSDAVKIAIGSRRPIPSRADSIGPWLTALGFLSWLGSVSSSAIVVLCRGTHDGSNGTASSVAAWTVLLGVLLAEHFYFIVQLVVRHVMSKIESHGVQRERRERYQLKKRMLDETLSSMPLTDSGAPTGMAEGEKITRSSLEEDARRLSIKGHGSPEEK